MSAKEEVLKKEKKKERDYIGLMMNHFKQCSSYGPHVNDKHIKTWQRGQIVWDYADITDLLKLKAPIEIYYKEDVDRTTKGGC